MSDYPDAWPKRAHIKGCDGEMVRAKLHQGGELVHVDRRGRRGNGGINAHVYRCNRSWICHAEVLVSERAQREIAVAFEVRS